MEKIVKWIIVGALVLALIVGGIYAYDRLYYLFKSPAVIANLRAESERAAEQYRIETDEYNRLLRESRGRIKDLEADLAREETARKKDIDRIGRLEDQVKSFRKLDNEIQASGDRVVGHNQSIGSEAARALQELREYRAALAGSAGSIDSRDTDAEG